MHTFGRTAKDSRTQYNQVPHKIKQWGLVVGWDEQSFKSSTMPEGTISFMCMVWYGMISSYNSDRERNIVNYGREKRQIEINRRWYCPLVVH